METYGSSKIVGLGAYLPEQRVSTDDLMHEVNSRRFRIPENYISKHIGIVEKRVADPNMVPSDLAVLASETALKDAGVSADEIDLIVYTGIARDHEEPGTAHNVQNKIGAGNAICIDVSNACLGFMTGISVADAFIANGSANTVLVCSGEKQSSLIGEFVEILKKEQDKNNFKEMFGMLTVGDAGGAMIVQRKVTELEGLLWMDFRSHGELGKLCYCDRTAAGVDGRMIMQKIGHETLKFHKEMIKNTYDSLAWNSAEVDKVYAHQIGKGIHMQIADIVEVDESKWPITYTNFGNLTSATIPVNMYLTPPNKGEKLLLLGAGSGVSVCQGGLIF